MKHPASLLLDEKPTLGSTCIRDWNYLYTRHKPSTDWNIDEGLPDFSKIKMDQSFNWCNFSIPVWARFDGNCVYKQDYAVAGFKVGVLRYWHYRRGTFATPVLDVKHEPEEYNYSHCELVELRKLNKTERREIRATFRHKCRVPYYPSQTRAKITEKMAVIIMIVRRIFSGNFR